MVSILILNLFLGSHLLGVDLDISKAADNDQEATKLLYKMAEDIGCNVSQFNGKTFILSQGSRSIQIIVKAGDTIPDRIIGYVGFRGKKENVNSEKFSSLANRINKKYNMCTTTYDDDGGFTLRYNLTFDDRLSPKLFRRWIDSVVDSSDYVLEQEKELAATIP